MGHNNPLIRLSALSLEEKTSFKIPKDIGTVSLIDGDGVFNVTGVYTFIKEVKVEQCGLLYSVVSIMGPQSSGKSTLLNHLFGTNFREMDPQVPCLQKSSIYRLLFCCLPRCKAMWVQLDISAEFRNGALPGLISLSTKLLPTVMNLLRKLAEEGQAPSANANVTTNGVSSSVGSSSSSLSSTGTFSNNRKDD